jgi:hypothetical protein
VNSTGRNASAAFLVENEDILDAMLFHSSYGNTGTLADARKAAILRYISRREGGSIFFMIDCRTSFLAAESAAICSSGSKEIRS